MLVLSGVNFKLTTNNIFKKLDDKMENFSRELETIKKNQVKTGEMNNTVTEIKS